MSIWAIIELAIASCTPLLALALHGACRQRDAAKQAAWALAVELQQERRISAAMQEMMSQQIRINQQELTDIVEVRYDA